MTKIPEKTKSKTRVVTTKMKGCHVESGILHITSDDVEFEFEAVIAPTLWQRIGDWIYGK